MQTAPSAQGSGLSSCLEIGLISDSLQTHCVLNCEFSSLQIFLPKSILLWKQPLRFFWFCLVHTIVLNVKKRREMIWERLSLLPSRRFPTRGSSTRSCLASVRITPEHSRLRGLPDHHVSSKTCFGSRRKRRTPFVFEAFGSHLRIWKRRRLNSLQAQFLCFLQHLGSLVFLPLSVLLYEGL